MTPVFVPFARPDISQSEIDSCIQVLKSGWLTTGPVASQFENEFTQIFQMKREEQEGNSLFAVSVNSATAALHLALEGLGIGPGDQVIVPVITFTASAEVVTYLGAEPVFVDVDPVTLNVTVANLQSHLTERTRAIMVVHFGGQAAQIDEILAFARRNHLFIIEDAAHALPTLFKGRLIGSWPTDVTAFSFYATKTMTSAEGGMVLTPHGELAARVRLMRQHGVNRQSYERQRYPHRSWHYEVVAPGYKYNLPDLNAALGLAQLRRLFEMTERRKGIARNYFEAWQDIAGLDFCFSRDNFPELLLEHSWHLFILKLPTEISRDSFIAFLSDREIECSVHFIPLHLQPYWKESYHLLELDFPVATVNFPRLVSLPIYSAMSLQQINWVVESVRSFFMQTMIDRFS